MLLPVKTLKEIKNEIQEELGVYKKLNPQNGYYFRTIQGREINIEDSKVYATMSFRENGASISLGHFKSKRGYNSKLKNNKDYANHYAEYISYLILKQLGKETCKVELGEIDVKNKYSNKIINVEGILSHYQITQEENFRTLKEIVESYKKEYPKKYREMTKRGNTDSEKNYVNVEIILKTLEELYTRNEQADKIPQMRKKFFDMCMFDLIFANRDRHDENFGIKVNQLTNEINFYPLFDNEQILGLQENKEDIIKYMASEKAYRKFKQESLTSFIGIPGEVQTTKPTTLLKYLLENYYDETMNSLQDIGRYKISNLEEVLEVCPGLSNEHKEFAKKIFLERQQELSDTINKFEQKRIYEETNKEDKSLEL